MAKSKRNTMRRSTKRRSMGMKQAPFPTKSRVPRDPPQLQQSAVRAVRLGLAISSTSASDVTVATISTAIGDYYGTATQFCIVKFCAWGPDSQPTTTSSRLVVTDVASQRDFVDTGTAGAQRAAVGISYSPAAQTIYRYDTGLTTKVLTVTGGAVAYVTVNVWK